MVWLHAVAAVVVVFFLLKELMRLPTVGKYGERYVFITGCDTGFGNQLAKRLDFLGFNVFAACFSERGADELRKVSSARLKTLSLDVSKPDSIVKARTTVEKQLPPNKGLWAIVNNAGVTGALGLSEWLTREDYERCNSINLYGVIDVTRIFLPLVRKGQGRIVNVSSVIGRIAAAFAPYVVSKYGVEGFTDCLRREVLKEGMTVHLLEPGYFRTNILNTDDMKTSFENSFKQTDPDVQRYYGNGYVQKVSGIKDLFNQCKYMYNSTANIGNNNPSQITDECTRKRSTKSVDILRCGKRASRDSQQYNHECLTTTDDRVQVTSHYNTYTVDNAERIGFQDGVAVRCSCGRGGFLSPERVDETSNCRQIWGALCVHHRLRHGLWEPTGQTTGLSRLQRVCSMFL
ncbi:retinol dehydrogenase 7-like isoform X3 [Haliotis cracherodii]|uniref:retinol dehydrogenase 7-like isoform X3 n=1 Tax=Haliotis cracherodii TaxID=6455 RepID=UPI0039E95B3B